MKKIMMILLSIGLITISGHALSVDMQVFFYNELAYPVKATLVHHDVSQCTFCGHLNDCPSSYPIDFQRTIEIKPGEFVKANGSYQNFCLKLSNWPGSEFYLQTGDHQVQLFHVAKSNTLDRVFDWGNWSTRYGMNLDSYDAVKNPRGVIIK